jgi:hypothetical protein
MLTDEMPVEAFALKATLILSPANRKIPRNADFYRMVAYPTHYPHVLLFRSVTR